MCDIRPGPRCPYDTKKKIESRESKLKKEISEHGENSPSALLAQQRLLAAKQQYDATTEGIEGLSKELSSSKSYDEELLERYKRAKITNEIQHLSVAEVKNGRAELIAQTYSNFFGYSKEEIYSTLETLREDQERNTLETINETALTSVDEVTWGKYIDNLESNVKSHAPTEENLQALDTLRSIPETPPKYILRSYMNLPRATRIMKEHEANSHKQLALLLGTTEETISKRYKELKNEYHQKYSRETKHELVPNPPEHWVKGESDTSGFTNNPNMRYAPHDNASMYATYRIMHDSEAIPDYQKHAKNYAFLRETKEELIIDTYSRAGKPISTQKLPRSTSGMTNLEKTLQGATLVTDKEDNSVKYPHLSLESIASQHLDLPSYSRENVAASLKESNLDPVHLLTRTINHSKRLWNNKPARRNA